MSLLGILGTVISVKGALDQRSAEKKAAADKAAVGKLEARQFVNELFLAKAQGIDAISRILEDAKNAESQNIAAFSAMGREDRSVKAILKANNQAVGEDVANIERQTELVAAKYATQAAVAYKYGQNASAGMRATSNANFLGNMYKIATNLPPSVSDGLKNVFKA